MIRPEAPADAAAIATLTTAAFLNAPPPATPKPSSSTRCDALVR
jgi:hypothetical protein